MKYEQHSAGCHFMPTRLGRTLGAHPCAPKLTGASGCASCFKIALFQQRIKSGNSKFLGKFFVPLRTTNTWNINQL